MSTKALFEKDIGEHADVAEKLKTLTYSEIGPVNLFELTETLERFEADINEELRRKLKQTKEPLPAFLRTLVPGLNKRLPRPPKRRRPLRASTDPPNHHATSAPAPTDPQPSRYALLSNAPSLQSEQEHPGGQLI
jgi:hypothetical protein